MGSHSTEPSSGRGQQGQRTPRKPQLAVQKDMTPFFLTGTTKLAAFEHNAPNI